MPPDRPDLPALFQRLADTLVRLFGERIDLARVELREDLGRIVALAARALVAAAAAAIGLVMAVLAATELLAPWVPGRPARLLLVGGPLLLAGALGTLSAARRLARERVERPETASALRDDLAALTSADDPRHDEPY